MRIATWNINSIRLRLEVLDRIARTLDADVICLQEIKVETQKFPVEAVTAMGYPHQVVQGFKGYNGTAILSRVPLKPGRPVDWCGRADGRHAVAGERGTGGGVQGGVGIQDAATGGMYPEACTPTVPCATTAETSLIARNMTGTVRNSVMGHIRGGRVNLVSITPRASVSLGVAVSQRAGRGTWQQEGACPEAFVPYVYNVLMNLGFGTPS